MTSVEKRASLTDDELKKLHSLKATYSTKERKAEQAYLSQVLKSLSSLSTCFWCKYGDFAVDCIPCLFSLPVGNPYTRWFKDATNTCLGNCKECVYDYYEKRIKMLDKLENEARKTVEKALYKFDFERLSIPMAGYVDSTIDHKQPALIYAIFEVMIYCPWLEDDNVVQLFGKTIEKLVAAKRMLRVTELLPGILHGVVSENEAIKVWCMDRLSPRDLCASKPFVFFDYEKLILLALRNGRIDLSKLISEHIPLSEVKVNAEMVQLLLAQAEKSFECIQLFLFWMQGSAGNSTFGSQQLDKVVKLIMGNSTLTLANLQTLQPDAPKNWLLATNGDIAIHGIRYIVQWLTLAGKSKKEVIEYFNRWSTFNQQLGLSLILALCQNHDLLQAFCVNVHYIACMFLKALEALNNNNKAAIGCQNMLFSRATRNLIICCGYAIKEQRMLPQYISFTNAYIKSIVELDLMEQSDILTVLGGIGELIVLEKKVPAGLEFLKFVATKVGDIEKTMSGHVLTALLLHSDYSAIEKAITCNFDRLGALLAIPWDQSVTDILKQTLHRSLPQIVEKLTVPMVLNILQFLSKYHESTQTYYTNLTTVIDATKNSKPSVTEKNALASIIHTLIKVTVGSIRVNGSLTQRDKCLFSLIQALTTIHAELPADVKNILVKLRHDRLISSAVEMAIREYETVMKVKIDSSSSNSQPKVIILNDTPNKFENNRRLTESIQSKAIPISAKPLSKLESIKSEMVRTMLPAVPAKKPRPMSMDSDMLASLPGGPKRVAHSAKAEVSETSEDDDEGDLEGVKDSLKGQQTEHRSVKMVEIDASGNVINPDIARLMPKKPAAVARDFTSWQRLQKHILLLDITKLSDSIGSQADKTLIPTYFKDHKEYQSIFEPLLFMEAEAQIFQSVDDMDIDGDQVERVALCVTAINMVDDFLEVDCKSDEKACRSLGENDIVLAHPSEGPNSQNMLMGIVFKSLPRKGVSEIGVRFCLQPTQADMQSEMKIGAKLTVKSVCNLITSSREHQALAHLPAFGYISEHILIPRYDEKMFKEADIEAILPSIIERYSLNRPQAYAVANAVIDPGSFTLIQGPPGTGKTRVIESIISTITNGPSSPSMLPMARNRSRIMLCAPSNAAVDELVRRLIAAKVNVVRVGSAEMIEESVKPVCLDTLVEKKMKSMVENYNDRMCELRSVTNDLNNQVMIAEKTQVGDLQSIKKGLWTTKEAMRKLTRELEDAKAATRMKILQDSSVVACTLSGAGHDIFSRLHFSSVLFEYVIVDEACQAVEVSSLIPLQWGARKVVLVGDPNQLPPTILSQAAINGAYEQSLFKRLQKANPEQVLLLSVQYRMHPQISQFPSNYYYQSRLVNGPGMAIETSRPWHAVGALGPYRFFDVPGQEEKRSLSNGTSSKSTLNSTEAQMVVQLVAFLCQQFPDYSFRQKIGIITPYSEQKKKIQRELMRQFGNDSQQLKRLIEVSTVDGFQGQESEIIIFSCVRTGQNRGVGFLSDARRMNVALTRAKSSLFVLGRAESLRRHGLWRALIDDAKSRGVLVPYDEEVWNEMRRACSPFAGRIPSNLSK